MKQQNKRNSNPAPARAKERRLPTTDGRYLTDKEAKAEGLTLETCDFDAATFAKLRGLAKAHGVTLAEEIGRLVREAAGLPPKGRKEPGRKRHLVIVADMPEAWGNAFEYGEGKMDTWLEEAFGCYMEVDFEDPDDAAWKADVERLFGVCAEGARDAFDVRAVGFVEGDVAATVRKLVEKANAPAVPENPNQMKIEAVEAVAAGAEVVK